MAPAAKDGPGGRGAGAASRRGRTALVAVWAGALVVALVLFQSSRVQHVVVDVPAGDAPAFHAARANRAGGAPDAHSPRKHVGSRSDAQGAAVADTAAGRRRGEGNRDTTRVVATTAVVSKDAAACGSASNCVDCLFSSTAGSGCVWCASKRRCVPAEADDCEDVEDTTCPAITTPVGVPQNFRVIHVAIRKGGPEALIQLHLALNHEGFRTTLDTRKSKKQKGGPVVAFFTEMYATEFAKAPPLRWEANYDAWLASAADGDVMIATETWACKNDWTKEAARGARQMQWHLTVWPKKPRTGCTIAAHTNHIAQHYMQTPRRAVLFPYISPHIVKLGLEKSAEGNGEALRRGKKNLVMYDGDVKLNDDDVKPRGASWSVKKATGFTPADLYAKYAEAKVGIDLVLPGAERFVYEASLFDVCIIVDNVDNGADPWDLPLPPRFRVQPNNLTALHERIRECVEHYDDVIDEQRALKQHTLRQRGQFHRHVRRYFSGSLHVVTYFRTTAEAEASFALFILHTLLSVSMASVEVRHAPGVRFPDADKRVLRDHSYLAAVTFVEVDDPAHAFVPKTTSDKRTAMYLIAPPETLLVAGDVAHVVASLLSISDGAHRNVVAAKQRFVAGRTKEIADVGRLARKGDASGGFDAVLSAAAAGSAAVDIDATASSLGAGALRAVAPDRGPLAITAESRGALSDAEGMRGRVRAVEAGAGDELTVAEYLCTHPVYARLEAGVCRE